MEKPTYEQLAMALAYAMRRFDSTGPQEDWEVDVLRRVLDAAGFKAHPGEAEAEKYIDSLRW